MNNIGFPGLGLDFNINRVAFSLFGKEIYWYGIIIVVAMLAGLFYATKESKRIGLPDDTFSDLILFGALPAIICARLYYVAFKWGDFSSNPLSVLYIWEGGIAIYGGIIGAFVTVFIYCKVKKIRFMKIADIGALSFLIGQAIGRWGNFINVEAYGTETTLPWKMKISQNMFVHPTFLYESLWNLLGFIILFSIRKKKPFTGFLFWAYLLWYGLGRAWIEGLRTDSLMLGNVRISQLIAGICIIVSVFVIIFKWKSEEDLDNAYKEEPVTTEETISENKTEKEEE